MQFQDWRIADRLSRARRAYLLRGIATTPEHYIVNVDFGSVAIGSQSSPVFVQPSSEAPFHWYGLEAVATIAGAPGLPAPNLLLRIEDSTTDKSLANHRITAADAGDGWAPLASVAGQVGEPYLFPIPKIVAPGGRIRFDVFVGAPTGGATQVLLGMLGFKFWRALV